MTPTILIVDDHDVFRAEARALLEAAGYTVIGEAASATDATEQLARLRPDVVLVDVQLPDRDGFLLADEIGASGDAPTVVLISSREATDYGSRIDRTPAAGFIHKPDLSRAQIELVLAGAGA